MRKINQIKTTTSNKWFIKNFVVKANEKEVLDSDNLYSTVSELLNQIENKYFSEEFNYWKTGFTIIHYGNRGINISIWHWGNWGNTIELYGQHWYCYGRDLSKLEVLGSEEPILCYFEIDLFIDELNKMKSLSQKDDNFKSIVNSYKQT